MINAKKIMVTLKTPGLFMLSLLTCSAATGQYEHFERLYSGMPFGHVFSDVKESPSQQVLVSTSSALGGFGLAQMDPLGMPVWFRTYSAGQVNGAGIEPMNEDTTLLLSSSTSFGIELLSTSVLTAVDGTGTVLWSKSYLAPEGEAPVAIRSHQGAGILLATAGSVARISSGGAVNWWHNLQARLTDAERLSDGSMLVTGSQGLTRLDTLGSILWSMNAGPDTTAFFFGRLLVRDDDVVVCGSTKDAFWLASFDLGSGTLLWQNGFQLTHPDTLAYRSFDLEFSDSGNLMLKVEVIDASDPQAYDRTFLMKTDAGGQLLWAKNFAQADELMGTIAPSDNGSDLVASAFFSGYSALYRVDVAGHSGCLEQDVPIVPKSIEMALVPSHLSVISDSVQVNDITLSESQGALVFTTLCAGETPQSVDAHDQSPRLFATVGAPQNGSVWVHSSRPFEPIDVRVFSLEGKLCHATTRYGTGPVDLGCCLSSGLHMISLSQWEQRWSGTLPIITVR